jgi:hypothetical protein
MYKFITNYGWTFKMNEPHGIGIHDTNYLGYLVKLGWILLMCDDS